MSTRRALNPFAVGTLAVSMVSRRHLRPCTRRQLETSPSPPSSLWSGTVRGEGVKPATTPSAQGSGDALGFDLALMFSPCATHLGGARERILSAQNLARPAASARHHDGNRFTTLVHLVCTRRRFRFHSGPAAAVVLKVIFPTVPSGFCRNNQNENTGGCQRRAFHPRLRPSSHAARLMARNNKCLACCRKSPDRVRATKVRTSQD